MSKTHILGFPRIGERRELKLALDAYWRGDFSEAQLLAVGRDLRARHWDLQRLAGLDFATVGDFAWYDHVLQTLAHLGGLPQRFGFTPATLTLAQHFSLARGTAAQPALEMTKWFDTNYHYLVPEWGADTAFDGGVDWLFEEISQAQSLGHAVKVTLLGPLTLLYLGKIRAGAPEWLTHKIDLLPVLIPAYQRLLSRIKACGVSWVQIDEPILALDLDALWQAAFLPCYEALGPDAPDILLATYFDSVAEHHALLRELPVSGLHLDLVRGRVQLPEFLHEWPQEKVLSLGVVDGRNVWRADLDDALALLRPASEQLGDRLWISASCSLLHVPVDLRLEPDLDEDLRSWLAFAVQKLEEIAALKRGLDEGAVVIEPLLAQSRRADSSRTASERSHNTAVRRRLDALSDRDMRRNSAFAKRIIKQRARLKLPLLPTTTIGSFPQTAKIRKVRAAFRNGSIGLPEYEDAMRAEIRLAIARQEELGLDVLVHGEAERNDMVEYFGERLRGFAVTASGWIQSYGSRCVKPPIIYGDVYRTEPITVKWTRYAQSLTTRPVKGMLTGPITILQWSFVREDQAREITACQIALALRDEVQDLERGGADIIQIDEPAMREGLPLKRRDWDNYLEWAVKAFRLASSAVADGTQIHTHMCYAEFQDILPAIVAMDADVITIETSRSGMELLEAFRTFHYPAEIGPGVYDIHSPRVPRLEELLQLLDAAAKVIPLERLWVNPDCGLKTRAWPETGASLAAMVQAARIVRDRAHSAVPVSAPLEPAA
ncbi:MAG: 5-methyltetrahydropteroyltriglutamate--homocysteine S-methyltransferase [Gammaproteobacteria bacterium]|nr:5-methyltetrahydropteroyltriglutamate--homocysteine S-methyltransferase [Gammaproteobacteria bacterium]